jgi:hypothetical protein
MIWDVKRKKCRAPKKPKSGKKKTKTSPGCGAGRVWDGKKCRAPENPKTKK